MSVRVKPSVIPDKEIVPNLVVIERRQIMRLETFTCSYGRHVPSQVRDRARNCRGQS